MIIDTPGKITDRILLLGRKESSVYLLDGKSEYALIGGGMVHIVPDVLEQLKLFGIEEQKIKRILFLHSHFDHCGMVPFFKKRWAWAKVTASPKSKELTMLPKYIQSVHSLNRLSLREYHRTEEAETLGIDEFHGIEVESVAKGGDKLACGDLTMEIMEVPGHSSCSIAVYIPEQKALFASDAGGIPFGNEVFTAANSDFDKYMTSLAGMSAYDVEIHLAEHYGAQTGEHGKHFLKKSRISAHNTRRLLEESLARTGDVGKSTEEMTEKLMTQAPKGFLPKEIIAIVVGQMLTYLSRRMAITSK